MVRSHFEAILKEFENFFHCPLIPDENNSCLIQMSGIGISMQIELDRYGLILLGCRLGVLHHGRFKNEVIEAALQSNASTPHTTGIFGFSQKSSQLILFMKLNPQSLTVNQILTSLPPFIKKAKQWSEAIASGKAPSIGIATTPAKPAGIFGLI